MPYLASQAVRAKPTLNSFSSSQI